MKWGDRIERFAANNLRIDLGCAFAAAICASALLFLISALNRSQLHLSLYARYTVTAVGAYLVVALLFHRFWTGTLRRMLPNWVLISICGSIVYVAVRMMPAIIKGWSDPYRVETSFFDYLLTEMMAVRSLIIATSLVSLPVTAVIYYAKAIVGSTRRWHTPGPPPSISETIARK